MRRYGLMFGVIALAVVLIGSLLAGVLLGPGRRPETWETALQRHLEFRALDDGEAWQVALQKQATSPTRFNRAMSRMSYGTGTHYRTQVIYQSTPHTLTGTQAISQVAMSTSTGAGVSPLVGGRPLPYPPDEVWCVLLTHDPAGASRDLLAFVALHLDLYNAEWVVHEAGTAPFDDVILDGLHAIGCDGLDSSIR